MQSIKSNWVSVDWLNRHLADPKLVILDTTMKHKPNGEVIEPPVDFIPGAKIFNFDTEICDQDSHLPHMLPPPAQFEQAVRKLGINQDSVIVVYDAMGIFSAPRAWWMFKVMGHQQVFCLDGGLPSWLNSGFETQKHACERLNHGNFCAQFNSEWVVSIEQVAQASTHLSANIIDARSLARFNAKEPEPRAGLKSGHIPGSVCLPFNQLLEKSHFKNRAELQIAFESLSLDPQQKNIFSCGSGVTACVLAIVADELGYSNYAVYDGSWSEWGQSDQLIV